MNKLPLTKKQIVNLFKKQKIVIVNSEKVNLENSEDRFLYENIKSKINLPPFNNSAVDGYAILKADLKTKKTFFCNRRIAAGDNKNIKIKPGEAVRIFTGAKVPRGCDVVIIQENVRTSSDQIYISTQSNIIKYQNIRKKGLDFKKGECIFNIGSLIKSRHLGSISMTGQTWVTVTRKPVVSILSTGNEI